MGIVNLIFCPQFGKLDVMLVGWDTEQCMVIDAWPCVGGASEGMLCAVLPQSGECIAALPSLIQKHHCRSA